MTYQFTHEGSLFAFGKYKGRSLRDVFEESPEYVYYCYHSEYATFPPSFVAEIILWASNYPISARCLRNAVGELKRQKKIVHPDDLFDDRYLPHSAPVSEVVAKAPADPLWGSW